MNKFLVIMIFVFISCSCSSDSFTSESKNNKRMVFTFDDKAQFSFFLPENGTSLISKELDGYGFSSENVLESGQNNKWLVNQTYDRIYANMISGKYTIRLSVVKSFKEIGIPLESSESLEHYLLKYYKQIRNSSRKFSQMDTGSFNWVIHEPNSIGQHLITAFQILDQNHYLAFTFEYLGKNEREKETLRLIMDNTLNSFSLQQI